MAIKTANLSLVDLPEADVEFIRAYASARSVSVASVFKELIQILEARNSREPDPRLKKWIGILPADTDVDGAIRGYWNKRHQQDEGQS